MIDLKPLTEQRMAEHHIISKWQEGPPRVSILCSTYRHAAFIRDALDGYLAQQTTFPFEILVRDDASDDGTSDIVRDYAARYPNIIRSFIERKNRFAETVSFPILAPKSRGEYVITAAGDDYWTDVTKLARQVAVLDSQPSAAACFHDAWKLNQTDFEFSPAAMVRHSVSARKWVRNPSLPIQTLMFRNIVRALPNFVPRILNVDTFLQAILASTGDAVYDNHIKPSVYRVHSSGAWSGLDEQQRAPYAAETFYWIAHHFSQVGNRRVARRYLFLAAQELLESHRGLGLDPRGYSAIRLSPPYSWIKDCRRSVRGQRA